MGDNLPPVSLGTNCTAVSINCTAVSIVAFYSGACVILVSGVMRRVKNVAEGL